MTRVKICGITQYGDAQVAVEAGADMLGFIFYPSSPRYIDPEHVREMVDRLPPDVKTVGVFVNASAESITRIVQTSGVQVVQLHGDERPELCQALSWPVVKAFRFTAQVRPEMMANYDVDAFLVEGFHDRLYGGAGAQADWPQVATLHPYGRIILAGGLTPENVQEAIRVVQPYAVDVGSGVEAEPGKKDWQKVRTFVQQAKTALPL
jgi:phosphoribosylanthranilate isomerase